ncbi:hypothetical protein TUBRATIS_11420 [Tubulinosema ratisbonensis]|uniref:CBF1-interacting co-repressor CIR N-terminal domain-containing protein n=1 Tax=Tubulinosema ratisbonensis TaxID=291195 RepID=A0A437AMB9_9MICR|nr:hypothetical protein TUBRATIS_11420 [Tubulinosema ratisbonensis]
MGTSNINSKKYWHPSRHETKEKVKKAEKECNTDTLNKEILDEVKEDRSKRMDWMLPEYSQNNFDYFDKKFTK